MKDIGSHGLGGLLLGEGHRLSWVRWVEDKEVEKQQERNTTGNMHTHTHTPECKRSSVVIHLMKPPEELEQQTTLNNMADYTHTCTHAH